MEQSQGPIAGLSDYLAAERTLLAWTRTALALMGFGFVVARFGLFLAEFQRVVHAGVAVQSGFSLWFGTAMIVASVVVNLLASWQHSRVLRTIDRGAARRPHSPVLAIGTSLFLAAVGLAMAIYLISVRSSATMQSALRVVSVSNPQRTDAAAHGNPLH